MKNSSKLAGVLGVVSSFVFGCAVDTVTYPNTYEVPEDFASEPDRSTQKMIDEVTKSGASIVIYEDYDAWFGEDRVEEVLQAAPFNLVPGIDYHVLPTSAIASGVPDGCTVAIITSNSKGNLATSNNVNNPAAQDALADFVMNGGTLTLHAADNIPQPYGFRAPGMSGPAMETGDSNVMHVIADTDHPFTTGPDGEMETPDDGTDSAIQFSIPCCAHHGSLDPVLPINAEPVITGLAGGTIYAQYDHGDGRVLVSTISFEYGVEGLYGHRERTVINHIWNALNGEVDRDEDEDGVPESTDCDDNDNTVGKLLFEDDFEGDRDYFNETAQLSDDPWAFEGGMVSATGPSQQALLGAAEEWQNVRVYATVASGGSHGGCSDCGPGETNRWRAGIVVRANSDADQDEGFNGYRCALASNALPQDGVPHAGESTGQFLQLAEFMDTKEDYNDSECNGGPNISFDELARSSYDSGEYDFNNSGAVELVFTAFENSLHCEFNNGYSVVSAQAYDNSLPAGGIGMSTLNMLGQFDNVKVCEAFSAQ